MSDEHFLSRWSRLKKASKSGAGEVAPTPEAPVVATAPTVAPLAPAPVAPASPELPPVESLTPESDFAPFMQARVEESVKRQALKTLFQDPRFNVMDGLDVYIDDYSKPDPLPEGWLEKMNQVTRLGDYHEPEPEAAEAEKAPDPAAPREMVPASEGEETAGAQAPAEEAPASSSDTSAAPVPPSELRESGLSG